MCIRDRLIYNGKYRLKSGGCRGKTNNQMEMLAVLNALKCITDRSLPVVLYSDSKYVIETLKGTYPGSYTHLQDIRRSNTARERVRIPYEAGRWERY